MALPSKNLKTRILIDCRRSNRKALSGGAAEFSEPNLPREGAMIGRIGMEINKKSAYYERKMLVKC